MARVISVIFCNLFVVMEVADEDVNHNLIILYDSD